MILNDKKALILTKDLNKGNRKADKILLSLGNNSLCYVIDVNRKYTFDSFRGKRYDKVYIEKGLTEEDIKFYKSIFSVLNNDDVIYF